MFQRIVAITLALIVLFQSTPAQAIEIANEKIPQEIWEIVPNPDDQEKVVLHGSARNGSKWQGGFLISSKDGSAVTFRRQIGEGKHRIEYDNKKTEYVAWVMGVCTEGSAERVSWDPRSSDAELRFIECNDPNQFEVVTHQAWYFPPENPRKN